MELWEQQKGERSKAFLLFSIYRDLGPLRSLSKALQEYCRDGTNSLSMTQMKTYSAKHNWVERTKAYDQYQDELFRTEQEEALKEMTRRHAKDTAIIQDMAMKVLEDPQVQAGGLEPSKLAWIVMTTANAYEKAGGFERLTRGESTEKISSELNAKVEADIKHDISVFDKVKKAKKLLEEDSEKDE